MKIGRFIYLILLVMLCSHAHGVALPKTAVYSSISHGDTPDYVYKKFKQTQSIEQMTGFEDWEKNIWPQDLYAKEYWVLFEVFNDSQETKRLIVEEQWAITYSMDLYVEHDNDIIYTHSDGTFQSIENRIYQNRYPIFEPDLRPGLNRIYIRYQSIDLPGIRFRVYHPDTFLATFHKENSFLGIILGSLFVMTAYNFCVFLVLRDRSYLYYSIYVAAFLTFQCFHSGYFFTLGLDRTYLWGHGLLTAGAICIHFVVKFSKEFLHLERDSRDFKVGTWVSISLLVALIVQIFDYQIAIHLIAFSDILLVCWVLYLCVARFKKDDVLIHIYIIAWGVLALADLFTVTYYLGLLPHNVVTKWALLVGSVHEAILISFALAYKVHQLRKKLIVAEVTSAKLDVAKTIQKSIIQGGQDIPEIDVQMIYLLAEETGGDWLYITKSKTKHRIYMVVGDVTGHGVGSAIITGVVRGSVETSIDWAEIDNLSPEETLKTIASRLNSVICHTGRQHGRLMSANIFVLDLEQDLGYLLNAGHLACYRNRGHEDLTVPIFPKGNILGFDEENKFGIKTFDFSEGVKIMTYTDGVLENKGEETAIKRKQLVRAMSESVTAEDVVKRVNALSEGVWNLEELDDDITMVVIDRLAKVKESKKPA